ncbi:PD-(D/E)XK nuclease superfamily [Bifidobacterium lemurum]|uniref:PD-(D/E)XK nuclease superfamily n=1 Tax=Bifidobacterium lemurum TaxID=1603886 RepID=A0A261FW11_9BIFI|nr:PD-(D/E)XK nuclease family protein [Bifidobacterium lemurum]OZG63308.1 PD-(D/E)XK nuclease superfamily [Bifidobacterium lemurum]QOL34227.1 PD-(D/E)XK nuclease family protein [Bifidobacterium lemurum]
MTENRPVMAQVIDLLHDPNFSALERRLNRINVFEIADVRDREIKHSNLLRWLMDPRENHGLGDRFVKEIISSVYTNAIDDSADSGVDLETFAGLILDDLSESVVEREEKDIDLLFHTEDKRFVLCIENKINASLSNHQLDKYRNYVEKKYGDYEQRIHVLLTRSGYKVPSDKATIPDEWLTLSYDDIHQDIENVLDGLDPESITARLLLQYNELLENLGIVENLELVKTIRDIHRRHVELFARMFGRPRVRRSPIPEEFQSLYNDHIKALSAVERLHYNTEAPIQDRIRDVILSELDAMRTEGLVKDCMKEGNSSYLWFQTERMDEWINLPDRDEAGSWGQADGNAYHYWIYPDDKHRLRRPTVQLEFGVRAQPDDVLERMDRIKDVANPEESRKPSRGRIFYRRLKTVKTGIDLSGINDPELIVGPIERNLRDRIRTAVMEMLDYEREWFKAIDAQNA